jgi:hypothetical protein
VRVIEVNSPKVNPEPADVYRVLGYIRECTPRIVCLCTAKCGKRFSNNRSYPNALASGGSDTMMAPSITVSHSQ